MGMQRHTTKSKILCVQVTTTRSNVRKPDIPLVTDPVSKLQAIGKETIAKLKDIRAAAAASINAEDAQVLEEFTHDSNCVTTGDTT